MYTADRPRLPISSSFCLISLANSSFDFWPAPAAPRTGRRFARCPTASCREPSPSTRPASGRIPAGPSATGSASISILAFLSPGLVDLVMASSSIVSPATCLLSESATGSLWMSRSRSAAGTTIPFALFSNSLLTSSSPGLRILFLHVGRLVRQDAKLGNSGNSNCILGLTVSGSPPLLNWVARFRSFLLLAAHLPPRAL